MTTKFQTPSGNWIEHFMDSVNLSSDVRQVLEYGSTDEASKYAKVSRVRLEKLANDIIELKQSLTKVLTVNGISLLHKKIHTLEQAICRLKGELEKKVNETECLKNKWNEVQREVEVYREENFQLKNTINVINEERSQEYEDILLFVGICLSLLWRLSLSDACVTTMLTRETILRFLEYISRLLQSFFVTNREDTKLDDKLDEFGLVLSLCGIITNIAATALGREFLVTQEAGIKVIDALILCLSEMPAQKFVRIKNLILKAVYNTSINCKGLKYLTSKKGLMTTLGCLMQDETDAELRLSLVKGMVDLPGGVTFIDPSDISRFAGVWNNEMVSFFRCIQSLVIEPDSAPLVHEVLEVVPISKLQEYADLSKGDLKKSTVELIADLALFLKSRS